MSKKPISTAEAGRRGGKARARNLSAEQLSRIGKKAVAARERKRKAERREKEK